MKLVVLRVPVADARAFEHLPKQALERGEFIVRRVVLLDELRQELKGDLHRADVTKYMFVCLHTLQLTQKGSVFYYQSK